MSDMVLKMVSTVGYENFPFLEFVSELIQDSTVLRLHDHLIV